MKPDDPLKNLRIAAPCPAKWASMAGDERVRSCSLCSLKVYNFVEMSAGEIRELLQSSEGRVCARLYQRADGTVLTRECPTGLRALRRRVSRFGVAVMGTLLTFSGVAFGGTGNWWRWKKDRSIRIETQAAPESQKALLRGFVTIEKDPNPLPGVTVILENEATKEQFTVVSDVQGSFEFAPQEGGLFELTAGLSGLTTRTRRHIPLRAGEITSIRIVMTMDMSESVVVGMLTADPLTTIPEPFTTTLPQSLIDKLPN
jgi:hypothetical protein